MSTQTNQETRRLGGLLMWFGALGGAVSWAVHLFVAWGSDELTCQTGRTSIQGIPLRAVIGAGVVLPALVTLAALAVAWRAWRQANAARRSADDPRMERAGMVALVGLCANALFFSIIVAGGAAVLVLSPCQR
ncbi:hypothetical protein ODJ79_41805 [Actinoplanes sp. KI2]|uniref:hypothetical protein n=1 Tax=Actinoplanes sp. KI2 TaxID=2983315 RepID=UPI0021D59E66|nr:hypothetical protein [Actinoplanes sp. KI2]MCU7730293.1 hypothetical protein [Actinoplanes sp. KI2]